jgi:hypothetical protein
MKIKLILILILVSITLLFPIVSAEEFSIEIQPHYYVQGHEIVYTSDIEFTDISFEILGKNNLKNSRIMGLQAIDAYPLVFKESLPLNIPTNLRILQQKTLWISQIIDIKNLKQFNKTNINLWVGISGVREESGEELYAEGHLNVSIMESSKEVGVFEKIGERIWEGNSFGGLLVLVAGGLLVVFLIWKYKGSDKLNAWREKSEKRRIEKRKYEEGY